MDSTGAIQCQRADAARALEGKCLLPSDMRHTDMIQLCAERDSYRAFYAKAWSDTSKHGREVDVILCPPSFGAATPHEQSRYWGYTCKFTLSLLLDRCCPIAELTVGQHSTLESLGLPRRRLPCDQSGLSTGSRRHRVRPEERTGRVRTQHV